jgi:Winged helix DNA-binding domain
VVKSMTRAQVLAFRTRAQQLDRDQTAVADAAVLDIGVQDTGPDGGLWALAIRGVHPDGDELATIWSIRGAPHLYRRRDLPAIAAAVAPWSDADAAKRIFDAAKPLKAAAIGPLAALDTIADAMRSVVTGPTSKGATSTAVTKLLDEPYKRFCRPCNAIHLYEQPFRLAAFRAGLELQPGTSPPILQPIPRFKPAKQTPERFQLIPAYLRLLGPATPKHVADYLDAPLAEVKSRWPEAAVEVSVGPEKRWALGDLGAEPVPGVRLLGPYDLFLQAKDRPLLVGDPARAKALWPVLGRPGAVLVDGDLAGLWRPRKAGAKLRIQLDRWSPVPAKRLEAEAERLAAFRGVRFDGFTG